MTDRDVPYGSPLPRRELQVLACAAAGYGTATTAARLHVNARTVQSYQIRAYRRLGARCSGHALALAYLTGQMTPTAPTTPAPELDEFDVRILNLAANGYKSDEIRARLGLSPWDVKVAMRRIFRKTGTHNRAHAVAVAFGHGILRVPAGLRSVAA